MRILFIVCFILIFSNLGFANEITVLGENQNIKEKIEAKTCNCYNKSKCLELISSMYYKRATLYNILNLSYDQQEIVKIIDEKRDCELKKIFEQYKQEMYIFSNLCQHKASESAIKKQKKVVNNLKKSIKKTTEKYDDEFKKVLNADQRSKLNTVRKMEKKEIKYCLKNKAFYKHDENLRPFGKKEFYSEDLLCPTHKKWHIFGFKHKE